MIFGYPVHDPERYGVVEFDIRPGAEYRGETGQPKTPVAVPGLYCFDNRVV